MHSIQSVLPIFRDLDGATLSPSTFCVACVNSGWPEPADDGIGLWEVEHPTEGTLLVLDTVMKPTTLICRLDQDDDYDPDDLLKDALRRKFDASFEQSLAALRVGFPASFTEGVYESPYHWRFAHFQGLRSIIALEQSDYDPSMGVQLVLLLQPLPPKPHRSAITSTW
jgi:hypothetical protein